MSTYKGKYPKRIAATWTNRSTPGICSVKLNDGTVLHIPGLKTYPKLGEDISNYPTAYEGKIRSKTEELRRELGTQTFKL